MVKSPAGFPGPKGRSPRLSPKGETARANLHLQDPDIASGAGMFYGGGHQPKTVPAGQPGSALGGSYANPRPDLHHDRRSEGKRKTPTDNYNVWDRMADKRNEQNRQANARGSYSRMTELPGG